MDLEPAQPRRNRFPVAPTTSPTGPGLTTTPPGGIRGAIFWKFPELDAASCGPVRQVGSPRVSLFTLAANCPARDGVPCRSAWVSLSV